MALSDTIRPTLLIGVGGTGITIAEKVYGMIQQTDEGRRARIGVLGFDTDTNDLNRLRTLEQRNRVALSSPDTVYQLLDKHPALEPTWFGPRTALPHDVLNMTLLDGAAQIRMLMRLGLHHASSRGNVERLLGDAVARIGLLNSREKFEGAMNVMVVGSLAGASGSGSFIQIALLVDQICRARNITADVRGLFLLPDVFVRGASLPAEQVRNVLANGYASLKELNAVNVAVMNADRRSFEFEYVPGHRLREGGLPFRNVALIDFENVRGGSLGRSLPAYQQMAARAVFLLIFTPIGQRTASVSVNDARAKLGAAGENLFAGPGVSAVKYPWDEVREYLILKLAIENLDGDWLRLDRAFFDRARRYDEMRRLHGNAAVQQRPDQGQVFLEDLDNLAVKDRVAFFSDIHGRLNPKVRDDRADAEVVAPRHTTFLDALIREMSGRFWSRGRLAETADRKQLDESQMKNRTALVDFVRRLENHLDDDVNRLDEAIATVPQDDFRSIVMTADDLADTEWRDYHLQTYIIKGGPHLVEVRAFLYALRREIAARRAKLNPADARLRVMQASNLFDDTRGGIPAQRRSPKTMDKAREAAKAGFLSRLVGNPFEKFQTGYVSYFNGSIISMRNWGNAAIALKALELLDDEVAQLERFLAGLFVELTTVFDRLASQANTAETLHGTDRSEIDGNVWVYADAAAKRAAWDTLREQSSGLRLNDEANHALAQTLFRRFRDDRKARRDTDYASLGGVFKAAVVDDFSRRVVQDQFRGVYDFTVIEAIRREAEMRKQDFKPYLSRVVDIAGSQAEPFLTLTDDNDGQRVTFWAIHPGTRAAINDEQVYADLFTFRQGEAPLEGEEFSDKELLCMNTRVNLKLSHLAKLQPDDATRTNVNVPGLGSYAREYTALVDRLIESEMTGPGTAKDFTPHLDVTWHRPGALPELFPSLDQKVREDTARAFIVSLSLGLFEFTTNYGREVADFSTAGNAAAGNLLRRVADTHDLWQVLQAFYRRPELTRAALRHWDSLRNVASAGAAALAALESASVPTRIADMAVVRDDSAVRENRVRQLFAAWVVLLQQAVALTHRHLAEAGRTALVAERVRTAWQATVAALHAQGVREETVRALERAFQQSAGDVGVALAA